MPSQGEHNRNALVLAQIIGDSDVIQALQLNHEMMNALRKFALKKGHRVVPIVAVHKDQVDWSGSSFKLRPDPVGDPHAQRVPIELESLLEAVHCHGHVTKPHRAGCESRNRARELDRSRRKDERSVADFSSYSVWIDQFYQRKDMALLCFFRSAAFELDPERLQMSCDVLQRFFSFDLPSDQPEVVALIGINDESMVVFIDAQKQRAVATFFTYLETQDFS